MQMDNLSSRVESPEKLFPFSPHEKLMAKLMGEWIPIMPSSALPDWWDLTLFIDARQRKSSSPSLHPHHKQKHK